MSGGSELVPRRNWLIATARYLTLAGLGMLVGNLIRRSGRVCLTMTPACHDCQLLAHCQLPKAQEERDQAGINS